MLEIEKEVAAIERAEMLQQEAALLKERAQKARSLLGKKGVSLAELKEALK